MDDDIHPGQTNIFDALGIQPLEGVPAPPPAPKLQLVTKTGEQLVLARGDQSLVEDPEDGLSSRVVHTHSRRKASIVGQYARMVGTGMKFHWGGRLWWVEFHAGPGRLFEVESGEFLPGSPLAAMSIGDRFDGYVFVDLDARCVESLKQRVARMDTRGCDVFVMQGDANSPETHDRITSIVPQDALAVMYADPEGLDFHLDTIKHFAARYRFMDWLINFPSGVTRYLSAGYDERAIRVLDDPNPRRFLDGTRPGRKVATIREVYGRQLEAMGFMTRSTPVYLTGGAVIYDMFLATKHERALDFFDKACGVKLGQYALFDPSG